jgi:hypothetical protein
MFIVKMNRYSRHINGDDFWWLANTNRNGSLTLTDDRRQAKKFATREAAEAYRLETLVGHDWLSDRPYVVEAAFQETSVNVEAA